MGRAVVVGAFVRGFRAAVHHTALAYDHTESVRKGVVVSQLRPLALPPPWAQQKPLDTEIVLQVATEHVVPPPCDQQTPLDLARLAQCATLHLTEPPTNK